MSISFTQTFDDRIAASGSTAAAYCFAPTLPKPCVPLLITPAGHVVSGFEMSDHIWHRGLWFTIKFINGTNFWEEHPPFGIQRSIAQPQCELISADELRVTHRLEWKSQATGATIHEHRVLVFAP